MLWIGSMKRRTALDIKKEIIKLIKKKEMSLRALETKVNTNYQTIKTQTKELEFFGLIQTIKHEKSKKNGRPYTSVKFLKTPWNYKIKI